MSGVTDPYQPVEREMGITRGCLEVLAEARQPLVIITKNHLVTRDMDLLRRLAEAGAVRVVMSVTTLDLELTGVMEPRTSRLARRLEAIQVLSEAGIPVSVNVAPIIPGLTDHECVQILEAAAAAGARSAGYTLVRLPGSVRELFLEWLEQHVPDRKQKVVNRLLDIRRGKLNRSEFGSRFTGEGAFADQIGSLFRQTVRRLGMESRGEPLSAQNFRRPATAGQMDLLLHFSGQIVTLHISLLNVRMAISVSECCYQFTLPVVYRSRLAPAIEKPDSPKISGNL